MVRNLDFYAKIPVFVVVSLIFLNWLIKKKNKTHAGTLKRGPLQGIMEIKRRASNPPMWVVL